MRFVGVLLIIIGTWFFFHPGQAVDGISKSLYKRSAPPGAGWKINGARVLSLLWIFVGILIFLKR